MSGSGRRTDRYSDERNGDDPRTRLRENATGIASLLVTGLWLGAMFTGQSWWLAALLVGYIVVVPLVAVLFGDEADREEWFDDWTTDSSDSSADADSASAPARNRSSETDRRDALESLRERYAAGELTDEQFERKLERLLATETLEDAAAWVRERSGSSSDTDRRDSRDRQRERDREYDR